ncbi:MAG: DUF3142 domain-containing protein [Pseudomonadota bacterium]
MSLGDPHIDCKSLRTVTGRTADWDALLRRCLCFAKGFGIGLIALWGVVHSPHLSAEEILHPRTDRIKPPIMLWAWERSEDLTFIDTHRVGVAFLARTVYIRDGKVYVRPRLQPLRVPENTYVEAVVRIETDRIAKRLSPDDYSKLLKVVADATNMPDVSGLQIDYDAVRSERPFYAELIQDMRHQLPDSVSLSITALASWCTYDCWFSGLPLDDAVPLLFRMGPNQGQIRDYLERGKDFQPMCRRSIGIATDEICPRLPPVRRIYVFNPKSWARDDFIKTMKEVEKCSQRSGNPSF